MVIRVRIVDNENVEDVNGDKPILSLKLNSHYNAIWQCLYELICQNNK